MPRQTLQTQYADQRAYELRHGDGRSWAAIAEALGMTGESVARAAANRHARRIGVVHEVNDRRAAAGRLAAQRRHNRGNATIPAGRAALVQNTVLPIGQRTFGAEIEFTGKYKHQAARDIANALHNAGFPVAQYFGTPHIHSMPYHGDVCEVCRQTVNNKYSQWRIERDGSVTRYRGGAEFGGEVVSPILTTNDFPQLEIVLKALREETEFNNARFAATVNDSCGLHIHVGVKDLTGTQRAAVVNHWYQFASVVHTFVSQKRVYNTYCHTMSLREMEAVKTLLASGNTNARAYEMASTKYRSLNVLPFPKIGTFEFRLHQGTLNFSKVRNWVTMLLAFVEGFATEDTENDARFGTETADRTVRFLDMLVAKTDATPKLKKFYFKRQDRFTPTIAARRGALFEPMLTAASATITNNQPTEEDQEF